MWTSTSNGLRRAALAMLVLVTASCAGQQKAAEAPAAASSGQAPVVAAPAVPQSARFTPDAEMFLCPVITVRNAPQSDRSRKITAYQPFIAPTGGAQVAVAPTNGACLTSGFGMRGTRLHKGVDYQSRPASMIVAAGDGEILEAGYRDDYGNMVLIDHGDGVYTRYAHLANLAAGARKGAMIAFGEPLGLMGQTSKYRVALHLHYEILTGDIANPKGSFGLTPVDPFADAAVAAAVQ